MSLKEILEKRAKLAAEIKRQADLVNKEGRDFTAEEKTAWEAANKDYDANERQREIAQRSAAVGIDLTKPAGQRDVGRDDRDGQPADRDDAESPTEETRALAFQGWCRFQLQGAMTERQEEACKRLRFNPSRNSLDIPLYNTADVADLQSRFQAHHPARIRDELRSWKPEHRALSAYIGPSGAYTVAPEALVRRLEIALLYYGGMNQVSEIIRTATGERMRWPTADQTTITGVQIGESANYGTETDPAFAAVFWDAYKFSSTPILVPYELLEDSAFDLVNILGDMLGERIGRLENLKFTTGSGAATPRGIVTAATSYAAASSTAIAADDLLNLIHQIDPAYRAMGCSFMMHDQILLILRKLKDGMGQYLWQSGLQQGVPDRLLSYGLTINQNMDSAVASGKSTVLFGQLAKYKIRKVGGMRMYRLEERFRDTDQDAFVAFTREDGNLLVASTAAASQPVKVLKHT